jgi:hypothetical protein
LASLQGLLRRVTLQRGQYFDPRTCSGPRRVTIQYAVAKGRFVDDSERSSRRRLVIIAVLVALVAAGVVVVVAIAVTRHHRRMHVVHGVLQAAPSSLPSSVPTSVPPPPPGFVASEFRTAAPIFLADIGGPTAQARVCRADEIRAVAATRQTSGGVLGVLRLTGTARVRDRLGHRGRCSLHVYPGSLRLLAADGSVLAVRRATGDRSAPPANQRSDIPLAAGDATLGFGWYGSYCGPPASAVEIRQRHGGVVRAPLRGPQPSCSGAASSTIVDGVFGAPGEPVQAARPEFAQLRLSARIARGSTGDQLAPIRLTLRTTGTTSVPVDPCPAYGGMFQGQAESGGFAADLQSRGYLPCKRHIAVVAPDRPLQFTIPASHLFETAEPGSRLKLRIGIAGVPVVQLSVTVH